MNAQTLENVEGIFSFISEPDFSNVVPIFGKIYQIFTNFQTCATESPITDIYSFCMNSKKETCSVQKLFENLSQNMFVLMGKVTEISTIIANFPAIGNDDLYDQTYGLGNDIGTLLRVISGFKPKAL